jgi:hypothetical protein
MEGKLCNMKLIIIASVLGRWTKSHTETQNVYYQALITHSIIHLKPSSQLRQLKNIFRNAQLKNSGEFKTPEKKNVLKFDRRFSSPLISISCFFRLSLQFSVSSLNLGCKLGNHSRVTFQVDTYCACVRFLLLLLLEIRVEFSFYFWITSFATILRLRSRTFLAVIIWWMSKVSRQSFEWNIWCDVSLGISVLPQGDFRGRFLKQPRNVG